MANFLNFGNIIDAVERSVKNYQSSMQTLVKSVINSVYLNEVLQADNLYPLHWLHGPIITRFHAPKTITAITAVEPPSITSVAHGFMGGEVISIFDVKGMTEINFDYASRSIGNIPLYHVTRTGANTFTLKDLWLSDIDATGYTAYTSGGKIFHHGWLVAGTMSDVIKAITSINIHDGMPLEKFYWEDLLESADSWISNSSGTPEKFINFQAFDATGTAYNYAFTFPGAQESQLAHMMIEVAGERLSVNGDVPLLPPQFHDVIISGAIVRLMESNVQVENAVVWPGIYKMQIDALKTYNRDWWESHGEKVKAPYLL